MSGTALSDVLQQVMQRVGVGAQTLSKLTGVPRTAIDNWRDGTVRRPRHWRPLLRIAGALLLSRDETDALLAAAGHPRLDTLDSTLPLDDPDRSHLARWAVQRRRSATVRHELRAPAPDFVGRIDAVKRIVSLLSELGGGGGVVGIRGMGGIGKTELALVAANELGESFPDARLIVNLRGVSGAPLSPEQAMRQVIHAFASDEPLEDGLEALQRRYCSVLSGRRVLILADDAADAAQVSPLLTPSGSALLVTSRQRFAIAGMTTVDLGELSEAEAVRLLETSCERLTVEEAQLIASACGHLPLALRISAGLLTNDPTLAVSEHLAALSDHRRRQAHLRDPDDERLDVTASLAFSQARLDSASQAVFRQLSVFVGDFDTALAEAVVRVPGGADTTVVLRLLLRRSLIGYEPARGRWRLHDLVRDLARSAAEDAGDWVPAMWRYAEAGVRMAEAIRNGYLSGGDAMPASLAMFDLERPHLDAGRRWLGAHVGDERADRLLVADAVAIDSYSFLRHDFHNELQPMVEQALAAARRLGDQAAEAQLLNQIGHLALQASRLPEAAAHFERWLAMPRPTGDRLQEMRALNNLSVAYVQLGQPRRAITVSERQLDLARADGNRRLEAMALTNLARTLGFVGEPVIARDHLELALTMVREDGERFGECLILDNLSTVHHMLDEPAHAVDLAQRAYRIAASLGDRERMAEASATLSQALVPVEPVAGADPAGGTGPSGADEAAAVGERALAIAREVGARRTEAKALKALGRAYAAAGRSELARRMFEEALAIRTETGDENGAADCAWLLGANLLPTDRERALHLMRRAVAHWTGIEHARVALHAARLAELDGPAPGSGH
ncbi:tetratricopeptide (TPR) repeat protein [Allocatelliglobosispora scoriae]|uniref:Tetratricopeptide (TPR) repeat protein n=1 Tax=Allocatelliglobosispora scoriae TaxID=643052 RepID=A0A841C120_9ACTN|nr:tetratricopeptide repeat protein [Allocatelliglobosispora scoriae]MBB5873625.1 tetratricopeptide (TPR) repeat protein [Allocatelliglobosispora scoriae]